MRDGRPNVTAYGLLNQYPDEKLAGVSTQNPIGPNTPKATQEGGTGDNWLQLRNTLESVGSQIKLGESRVHLKHWIEVIPF